MNINLTKLMWAICLTSLVALYFTVQPNLETRNDQLWSSKKSRVKGGLDAYQKPDGFIEYFNTISKKIGAEKSSYKKGYKAKELSKSISKTVNNRGGKAPVDAEFISRGPGNVGGRTRAIAIDPDDATHCTWIAGAASGGLWKTTDCGLSWTNLSDGLPNLSTNSIAQAASNPDVLYVGTGEVFAGNSTFVRGDGVYKTTDRGVTWNLLPSTVENTDYVSVNRIAVDPTDEDIVVIATNSGIFRSTDGGGSWIKTYNSPPGSGGTGIGSAVQDLQVDPTDFSIQYAGVNSVGVVKSTDAGLTWSSSSNGITDGIRFELAVAPSNTDIVYASSYSGETTILYYSGDKGENWVRVNDPNNNTNFLGAQGWYDNTVEVNPYNPYEAFVGGVSIGKFVVDPNNIGQSERQFAGTDSENVDFLAFITFGADFNGGTLNISDGNLSPSDNPVTIEIRWGGTNTQKAHRFEVPSDGGTDGNGGAGIPPTSYTYQDYVDVPFEVWDIENDRQLMVSFRDQQADGEFNLNPRDDENDPGLLTAREYFYIHDLDYDATTPNSDVSTLTGGVEFANMYYFWPVLAAGTSWDPASYTDAIYRINYGAQFVAEATSSAVYDAYGNWEGQNSNTLHPDHHHLTFVKTDEANEVFMVINGNDGAFGFSDDNGVTFEERESGYVTSQFYGADKKPGEDKYIGGMQDNGTYVSSGATVDATNEYDFRIGGDGFEVIWHATNPNLVIGGSQFNGFRRSTNGGQNFSGATSGMADDGPFISRLAGSTTSPDVIYALGTPGVYKSTNFGASWTMKAISASTWSGGSQASDVEVSLANDQIVWAGAGMASGILDIFVSIDGGETYNAVGSPDFNPAASITGIYTHPFDENTAYVLFSVANQAKILKTEDLGQTWVDLSGFGANAAESSNGFPDVFTHSLLVMPFDTDIIWVGTEIGLFESLDGGISWNMRNDFPSASIWSMKIVDDQVVMGTHGRGIWTATIAELAPITLKITDFTYSGYGKASYTVDLPVIYDQVEVFVNDVSVLVDTEPVDGITEYDLDEFFEFDGANIKLVGTYNGSDYITSFTTESIDAAPQIVAVSSPTDVVSTTYPVTVTVENNEPFEKVEVYINNVLVHTDNQSLTEADGDRVIEFNYDQASQTNAISIIAYINELNFVSSFSQNLVTSNKEDLTNNVRLYPNPVVNRLTINSENQLNSVKIYNNAGQLIYSKSLNNGEVSKLEINTSDFKEGMYLVQLVDVKGAIRTSRIIKN